MMQKYIFDFRSTYNHPDFVVYLNEATSPMVDWLSDYFARRIKAGIVFHAGDTIQVGWMLLTLKRDAAGNLELWEPSFDKIPIEWTQGASNTLRFLSIQKEVCGRVGTEPDYPSLRQSALMSLDFLGSRDGFDMTREQPNGMDSGWVFQRHGVEAIEGRHRSTFEIAINRLLIIPFLAPPPKSSVRFSAGEIEVEFGSKIASSKTDRFLNGLRTSPAFA